MCVWSAMICHIRSGKSSTGTAAPPRLLARTMHWFSLKPCWPTKYENLPNRTPATDRTTGYNGQPLPHAGMAVFTKTLQFCYQAVVSFYNITCTWECYAQSVQVLVRISIRRVEDKHNTSRVFGHSRPAGFKPGKATATLQHEMQHKVYTGQQDALNIANTWIITAVDHCTGQ